MKGRHAASSVELSSGDWEDPDAIADVKPGDVLMADDQGRHVIGIAHHTTNGAWFTQEGGMLLRPGRPFVWLDRLGRVDVDHAPGTMLRVRLVDTEGSMTILRTVHGWRTVPDDVRDVGLMLWLVGDPPLPIAEVIDVLALPPAKEQHP